MMMDAYGLPATTSSPAALDAYDRAVRSFLEWGAESTALFQAAVRHDPQFALAWAGLAVSLFADEEFEAALKAVATARAALGPTVTERERRHVEALALSVEGKL